ncbi:MAG: hypothetical protein IJ876_04230 [Elusimicrobiaceae bacterium]|nr:hypothetical protein [Elusimicrobiaceae bacterium]
MKKEYNFANSQPNPYITQLRKPISIRLNTDTIAYFKQTAQALDISYHRLISMYLEDCAVQRLKPSITWK